MSDDRCLVLIHPQKQFKYRDMLLDSSGTVRWLHDEDYTMHFSRWEKKRFDGFLRGVPQPSCVGSDATVPGAHLRGRARRDRLLRSLRHRLGGDAVRVRIFWLELKSRACKLLWTRSAPTTIGSFAAQASFRCCAHQQDASSFAVHSCRNRLTLAGIGAAFAFARRMSMPDFVARMERSGMRGPCATERPPGFRSLHPGYEDRNARKTGKTERKTSQDVGQQPEFGAVHNLTAPVRRRKITGPATSLPAQ